MRLLTWQHVMWYKHVKLTNNKLQQHSNDHRCCIGRCLCWDVVCSCLCWDVVCSCLCKAISLFSFHRDLALVQSTLNHQSQMKYSCWNKVPLGHRKLCCKKIVIILYVIWSNKWLLPEWGLLCHCLCTRGMTDILSLDPHNILHPLDLDTRRRCQELCCRWDSLCQGSQGCFPPRLQQPGNMIRRNLTGESIKLKRIFRIKFLSAYSKV